MSSEKLLIADETSVKTVLVLLKTCTLNMLRVIMLAIIPIKRTGVAVCNTDTKKMLPLSVFGFKSFNAESPPYRPLPYLTFGLPRQKDRVPLNYCLKCAAFYRRTVKTRYICMSNRKAYQ